MATQVTIKMTAQEFDDMRKAVTIAQNRCRELWQESKARGEAEKTYGDHWTFENTCGRLLKNVLS